MDEQDEAPLDELELRDEVDDAGLGDASGAYEPQAGPTGSDPSA